MDRATMKKLGTWLLVGGIFAILLAVWVSYANAADAVEQGHGIRYYPHTLSDAGYPVGDDGIEEVRQVQVRLYELGYAVIIDGVPGPGTDAALRAFQRDKHLTITGEIDGRTFKALWSRSRAERDDPGSGSGGSGVVDFDRKAP